MSELLILIQGDAPTREELKALGVLDLLTDAGGRACSAGPGGPGGNTFAGPGCAIPGYHAERQEWRRDPVHPQVWYGWGKDAPPGPDCLARPQQIGGHLVTLGDGREWLAPVARLASGVPNLPRRARIGPEGAWVLGDVIDRYAALWGRTERIFDAYMSQVRTGSSGLSIAEAMPVAIEALALNYRLNAGLCDVLGLFDSSNWLSVVEALIDVPTFVRLMREMQEAESKKNAPAPPPSSASPPGGMDGPSGTGPPGANSPPGIG